MSTPTTVAEERPTRREELAAVMHCGDAYRTGRVIWDTLSSAEPIAVRPNSALSQALRSQVSFRDDLDPALLEQLHRQMPSHAVEIFRAFQRGLSASPLTLEALGRGYGKPVRSTERDRITAAVARKMVVLGFEVTDSVAQLVTYAAVDDVNDALKLEA